MASSILEVEPQPHDLTEDGHIQALSDVDVEKLEEIFKRNVLEKATWTESISAIAKEVAESDINKSNYYFSILYKVIRLSQSKISPMDMLKQMMGSD